MAVRVAARSDSAAVGDPQIDRHAFRRFPYGLLVAGPDRTILTHNLQAERLIEEAGLALQGLTCCDLLGCRTAETVLSDCCVTEMALARQTPLPELRIDLETSSGVASLWIAAAAIEGEDPTDEAQVVIQLRPGIAKDRRRRSEPHWMSGAQLRIRALGGLSVESAEGPITGDWIEQRTGELLRYLLAERHRSVPVEQIGENVWPRAGYSIAGNVRYYIHALRSKLEPARTKRDPSSFILSRAGGYRLNLDRIRVDADEFEAHVSAGLALVRSDVEAADIELERGLALYRGEFLADLPYAEWALDERHRLHELACLALRELADLRLDRRMFSAATRPLERLAAMQPYDETVHRQLMELDVLTGRPSNAIRRYEALRSRMRRTFKHDPSFSPADLGRTPGLVQERI